MFTVSDGPVVRNDYVKFCIIFMLQYNININTTLSPGSPLGVRDLTPRSRAPGRQPGNEVDNTVGVDNGVDPH